MSCLFCQFKIGANYNLKDDCVCEKCQSKVSLKGVIGTYLGFDEGEHKFRLHPHIRCSNGHRIRYVAAPCDGIDVSEEFASIPNRIKTKEEK